MDHSNPGKGNGPEGDKHAGGAPGEKIPKRPADSDASGEARNDTGEDNQRQKGERPAEDFVPK